MGNDGKMKKRLSSTVIACLALLSSCLFINSCNARSIVIQQVTHQQESSDEPKLYQLPENESSNQSTILGDEPQSSYMQDANLGITRTLRDQTPSTYLLKINKFSELKSKPPRYDSAAFDAAGFKWRLIFFQNGNANDGGKNHISLYLRIENLPDNSEVDVELKLFVYNQRQKKYLTIQDGNIKRFSKTKPQWGFGQLLPLSTFSNPSNGYLVNDVCVLGVEIFVIKPAEKTETLSFIRNPADGKFTWKILHFSNLDSKIISPDITVGGRNWRLWVYPNGAGKETGKSLSIFLYGWSYPQNAATVRTYGSARVRLLNQRSSNHLEKKTGGWYNVYPYISYMNLANFISLKDLNDESKGYLVNDKIILEVEFDIVSETKVVST